MTSTLGVRPHEEAAKSKEAFKNSRDNVDTHTAYANDWLPEGFNDKNISTFGKTVFQNIIKDTVEQRRGSIISQLKIRKGQTKGSDPGKKHSIRE